MIVPTATDNPACAGFFLPRRLVTARNASRLLLAALVAAAAAAHAQEKPGDYPRKPVRIVVGIAPGGGLDTMCRLGAHKLSERWGRSVIVDNRPGGGTVVGMDLVSHAQPDGYTLLGASNTLMLNGALSYGSQGLGTTGHVGWERFKLTAGVDILHVPYKGAAPAVIDTVSGQIQMTFSNTVTSGAHIKSGRLRGLAITSLQRGKVFPDMPTVSEAGVPGFELSNSYAFFAPAGAPQGIIREINGIVSQGMNSPATVKLLAADGSEALPPATPEAFTAQFDREYGELEKTVRAANIRIN